MGCRHCPTVPLKKVSASIQQVQSLAGLSLTVEMALLCLLKWPKGPSGLAGGLAQYVME